MLTKIIGVVPSSICGMLSFKMPQSTLVGKSGPATKMHTFPGENPGAGASGKPSPQPKPVPETVCKTKGARMCQRQKYTLNLPVYYVLVPLHCAYITSV
eukprot:Skav206185  [mRNA]  locus=scaffold1844:96125:96421:+ [translate_table: standard]